MDVESRNDENEAASFKIPKHTTSCNMEDRMLSRLKTCVNG